MTITEEEPLPRGKVYTEAQVMRRERQAYIQGLRNGAETLRSFRATEGVAHQPTMDTAASILEDIAARAALQEIEP